jgi:hypothetical protein
MIVRGVWGPLLHELSAAVSTVYRLCGLCRAGEENGLHYLSRFRLARCQDVVSRQFHARQRDIYGFEKFGELFFFFLGK